MKSDWKKLSHYRAVKSPLIIDIPEMNYLVVQGKGNPNASDFQQNIQSLYGLAYPIKIQYKKQYPDDDFTVYPLEGIWDLDDEGRTLQVLDKNHFMYDIMIAQPVNITKDFFENIQKETIKKKKDERYARVHWKTMTEGLCCQMLHLGSFDSEHQTFEIMERFVESQGYVRTSKVHREIYLSDARKTPDHALKTILRFRVQKKE
jgi:hypothetical protein